MTLSAKAARLLELHEAPELLTLVNVWDPVSAKVVAGVEGTAALATASHSIAASFGYEDGERIPLDLHLEAIGRIVASTDLPVSADLEAGYGDVGETIRRAIGVGVVGANIEDQLRPLDDAVRNVEAALAAGEAEGIRFVLNARTDAMIRGDAPLERKLDEAIRRGRAYLAAGAPCVFVPGLLDEDQVTRLVEELGERRVSVIHVPGSVPLRRLEELGVARVSFGPWPQRVALTALEELVLGVREGRGLPEGTRVLN